jgi:hypothetical protein
VRSIAQLAQRILSMRLPRNILRRSLFDKQQSFFDDLSSHKAACCTRRAGKSHAACTALVNGAYDAPGTDSLYLGLTRRSSKSIMWPKFSEVNQLLGKQLSLKESELLVTLPNDSRIWVMGADIENLADRLRGNKYRRVIVDEAQSFGTHLQYLIDDVLEPALLDLQGDMCLLGTPGPVPAGVFYDAMCGANSTFSRHRWSLLENPHLPHAGQWLEALKKRKGWDDSNPTYRREYLGEWCLDPDALVYRFDSQRHTAQFLPPCMEWQYVLGLDYGWHDKTAFAILAYSDKHPIAYIVKSWAKGEMIPSAIAEEVQTLNAKYKFEAIVCDTGGLGKSITEEFRQRYGLPVRAAEKTDKMAFIASFNGELIKGNLKVIPKDNADLINQWNTLQYDDRRREDQTMNNDLCDANLYASRYIFHYLYRKPEPKIEINSPAWNAKQEDDMLEQLTTSQQRSQEWI